MNYTLSGKGAMRLAEAVLKAVEEPVDFKFLYDVKVSLESLLIFDMLEAGRSDDSSLNRASHDFLYTKMCDAGEKRGKSHVPNCSSMGLVMSTKALSDWLECAA